jgi:hypothetical protein
VVAVSDDWIEIYCCGCGTNVRARAATGLEIYPHRPDLHELPFWVCRDCGNYVGCHHKTATPTKPLGNIPTKEIRGARQHIHKLLDPIWKTKKLPRGVVYAKLSEKIGYPYHTGEVESVEQARIIYKAVQEIAKEVAQ